jgi:hypothetical protein
MIKKRFFVNQYEFISLEWSLGTAEVTFKLHSDYVLAEFSDEEHHQRWQNVHFLEFQKLPRSQILTDRKFGSML